MKTNTHDIGNGYKVEPFTGGRGMYLWRRDEIIAVIPLDIMKQLAPWMENMIQAAHENEESNIKG